MGVAKAVTERLKIWNLRKHQYQENIKKIFTLARGRPYFAVSIPEIRLWSQQPKIRQKHISKFFGSDRLCLISLLCTINFLTFSLFTENYWLKELNKFAAFLMKKENSGSTRIFKLTLSFLIKTVSDVIKKFRTKM